MKKTLHPEDWGLRVARNGALMVGGCTAVSLAGEFGTPLHVVNTLRLKETAETFRRSAESNYPGTASVHYAFKCNSVPAVCRMIKDAGLKAEVMSPFELNLALFLGYGGEEIIVNGPCKTDNFLRQCLQSKVRLIVIDSLDELKALENLCADEESHTDILFRINPDYIPRGLNQGAATGSRKGCAFGLDLKGGEVPAGFRFLGGARWVRFRGFHFHIGTGIRDPREYSKAMRCLVPLLESARTAGQAVGILDVGGGFASMTTREFSSRELLIYQGMERLPSHLGKATDVTFDDFTREVSNAVLKYFPEKALPELLYEPGRSIVSSSQFLLLTVHRVKDRPGLRKWLITDGGLGTVTLPTFYEYHEVFLCNDVRRPRREKVNIVGSVCFASDVVYRNKRMPRVHPGEVLAIMDSGAYFTAFESSFGFARPAIVAVNGNNHHLIRRAEVFEDLVSRDVYIQGGKYQEV